MTTEYLLYVPHHDVEKRKRQGWRVVDDFGDIHHGQYAVLMKLEPRDKELFQRIWAAVLAVASLAFCLWAVLTGFQSVFGP